MNEMHTSKILVTVTAAVGIISCFIPWANQLFFGHAGNVTGIHFSEGLFCLVYFLLAAVISLITGRTQSWSARAAKGITVTALLPIILIAYKITQMSSQAVKMQQFNIDTSNYVVYNPAMGLYATLVSLIAIVLIVILTVLLKSKTLFIPATWFGARSVLVQS